MRIKSKAEMNPVTIILQIITGLMFLLIISCAMTHCLKQSKKVTPIILNEYFHYYNDSLVLNRSKNSTYFYLSEYERDSLFSDALNKMSDIIFNNQTIK